MVSNGAARRSATMARAMRRAARSSPSWKRMSASRASGSRFTRSAAEGPARSMRMSSGPSCRNEKPRAAVSSCIEETPMSSTTPSSGDRARLRGDAVELAEAPLPQLQPAAIVAARRRRRQRLGVAVDRRSPAPRRRRAAPRRSRRRRRCRRARSPATGATARRIGASSTGTCGTGAIIMTRRRPPRRRACRAGPASRPGAARSSAIPASSAAKPCGDQTWNRSPMPAK